MEKENEGEKGENEGEKGEKQLGKGKFLEGTEGPEGESIGPLPEGQPPPPTEPRPPSPIITRKANKVNVHTKTLW